MTSQPARTAALRGLFGALLAILGLWGMAVAQPLFDLLGRTTAFFVAHRADRTDLVLFALAVSLIGPAVLGSFVLLLRRFGAWSRWVEAAVWGLMVALVAAHWMSRWAAHPSWIALLAMGAGALSSLALLRWRASRTFAQWLGALALVFPLLFLFASPARKIGAGPESEDVAPATSTAVRPLAAVLVVLDEFPLVSLLDGEELIDAVRYPNFAALAETATWYRNATTVAQSTAYAVPAILSGRYPAEGKVSQPVWSDYRRNLFTTIDRRANMHAVETMSRLCPESLCSGEAHLLPRRFRLASMMRDAGAVYLHLVTPSGWSIRLPEIGESWRDFWAPDGDSQDPQGNSAAEQDSAVVFDQFLEDVPEFPPPALHYLHLMAPHLPWNRLPDGTTYPTRQRMPHGLRRQNWRGNEWETVQAQQRHLLHVGWVDGLIGRLRETLEREGLWHDAIVVVTSDHGTSFETGGRRRNLTTSNFAQIVNVPLLIKYPGQTVGEIDDSNAETIDIMPTLLAALGVPTWGTLSGHDLAGGERGAAKTVYYSGLRGSRPGRARVFDVEDVLERRQALARKIERFGTGSWDQLYAAGPFSDLIGRSVEEIRGANRPSTEPRAHLDRVEDLEDVDLDQQVLPVHLTGWLAVGATTDRADAGAMPLLVAVNGTVRATTETYFDNKRWRFTALIPKTALVDGKNTVEIFRVSGPLEDRRVRRLRGGTQPAAGAEAAD